MLRRGGKFKPKVGPRGPPRPAQKPVAQKEVPTPDAIQNESTSQLAEPQLSSTSTPIAVSPLTEIQPHSTRPENGASQTQTTALTHSTPSQPSEERPGQEGPVAVTEVPPATTISSSETRTQKSSTASADSNTSALESAPAAPAETSAVATSEGEPDSPARTATRPPRTRNTRAAQTSRTTRASSNRKQRRTSPAPRLNGEASDNEAAEPSPPLTIQEAIAINTANKNSAGRGKRKGNTTQRGTRPRKRKSGTEGGEEDNDAEARPRKRRSRKRQAEGDEAQARGQRALTPENAEEQVIDPVSLTLGDVTRDLRIGRKFSKHDELLQREKDKKQKQKEEKRAKKLAEIMGQPPPDANKSIADGEQAANPDSASASGNVNKHPPQEQAQNEPPLQPVEGGGPRFEIVDGQLVIDQNSLQIDIHANTMNQNLPEVVEDDFTHLTTSRSHLPPGKRIKNPWTDDETALFYTSLRMFGTDFLTISKMFPHKNRRQVKLKFNREERANPDAVNRALVGVKETKIDIDMFKLHSRRELRSVEEIEAEHRAEMEELQRKEDERKAALEEENRKKREELERTVEEEKKRKGKRKKKAGATADGGVDDGGGGGGGGGGRSGGGGDIVDGPAAGPVPLEEGFGRGAGRVQAERPAFGSRPRF